MTGLDALSGAYAVDNYGSLLPGKASILGRAAFIEQVGAAHEQGWYANIGERAPERSAVAVALDFGGDLYGLSIGGSTERIRERLREHVATLIKAKEQILLTWQMSEGG